MIDSQEKFIARSQEIHGNLYGYDFVVYKNTGTKVRIVYKQHGEFSQSPEKHLIGQGCPGCRGNKISKTQRLTKEEFVKKAISVHKNKYNYDNVEYINAHTKIIIICKKHGQFKQTPNNHLYDKTGCPPCGCNSVSNKADRWLDSLGIKLIREYTVPSTNFKVDGFDPITNIVYEYLGKFWHGCPISYNPSDINPRCKITYGELYIKTMDRLDRIRSLGYEVIFVWGD